ncbi:hypothetical protein FF950_07225 [Pseudoxanthomonas sp. X-1]|nr:hypothetical protein FF950_07225 [Pseudoxanthomonas sp. X-1]UAY75573.1 hypothetical protein LAJ50_04770 [Pseudoxanthomonas sp. X-1]
MHHSERAGESVARRMMAMSRRGRWPCRPAGALKMSANAARACDRLDAAEGEGALARDVTWLALAPHSRAHSR